MEKHEIEKIRYQFIENMVEALYHYGFKDPTFLQKFLMIGEEAINMSGSTLQGGLDSNIN